MKVLVVDDQELNRNLLQHMLKHEGFEVVLAKDGYEAIEQTKKENPDLILLDVVMPNLDGYETAPRLKELSGDVYLPVIFITALGDQESLKRCLDVGGDDFLNKPFDRVILEAKIKAHSRIRDLSIKTFEQKKQLDFYRLQTEREHQIVEHIFNRAVEGNYKAPHIISHHISPASMFNGDIMLMALGPTGNLYVMIGDFTGHGLAAAVGTLPVSRAFYSMAQKGMALGDIADEINNILLTLLPDDMFCAASIIELNNTGKSISIWAGGTPDMYLLNKEDNSILTIGSQHMALGILEPAEFETNYETFAVNENQCLIAFTDGVVELFNEDKEMFGYERLEKLLTKTNHNSIDDIVSALNQFKGAAESDDDISILSIKCKEVGSAQQNLEVEYSKLPHTFQLSLDANTVKTSDPVVEVVDMITYIRGAEEHRSTLFLLLSEAYNNALDHGLLGLNSELKDSEDGFLEYYIKREELLEKLDSGEIQIEMKYEPSTTTIYLTVTDSGSGFNTLTSPTIKNDNQEHGRGNVLLKELASSISYNEQGNQITIGYQLQTQ